MVEVKKQVAESFAAKIFFRSFRRNKSSSSQPPNTISNVESDLEEEEEENTMTDEETKEEQLVELNAIWDIILPNEEE